MSLNSNLLKIGLAALAVLVILSGIFFFFFNQTATTKGVVNFRREANNTYFVTYTYLAPEPNLPGKSIQTYQKQVKVNFADYNYYYEGTEVTVKYSINNPQDAELVNQSESSAGLLTIVGVTIGAILVVLLLTFLFIRRRNRKT